MTRSCRSWLRTISVAALLPLIAIPACTYAQNHETPASFPDAASDGELAARVKAALRAAPDVNDTHIEVSIQNGKVVLSGLVEDNRALLDALRVAKKAAQGREVMDALTIMKTSPH